MTRPKRLLFSAILVVLVLGFVEGASRVAYRLLHEGPYIAAEIGDFAMEATFVPRAVRGPAALGDNALHPFLGYVATGNPQINAAHGFYGSFPPEGEGGQPTKINTLTPTPTQKRPGGRASFRRYLLPALRALTCHVALEVVAALPAMPRQRAT